MKFYIAARVSKKSVVRNIHEVLVNKRHETLSTWIDEGQIKPYNIHSSRAKRRAIQCIDAIKKSDVFILISDKTGAGMYTELGMAIVFNHLNKKPKIFVVGSHIDRSMFFFHPSVKRKKNLNEVLKDI